MIVISCKTYNLSNFTELNLLMSLPVLLSSRNCFCLRTGQVVVEELWALKI